MCAPATDIGGARAPRRCAVLVDSVPMPVHASLRPTRGELAEMARLATPLVLVNIGTMLMGVVDAIMLGHVSGTALAAGALGNFYFWLAIVVGYGLLMSLDPVISQAVGAHDAVGVARGVQRGVVLAVIVAVATSVLLIPAPTVLDQLRQPADVAPLAGAWARWSIAGLLPFFLFGVFRSALQAIGSLRPILVGALIGNVVNVVLDWILIFGHLGASPGGVVGSSQATAIARWVMCASVLVMGWPALRPALLPWRRDAFAWQPLRRMITLGLPIGFQFFAEFNAFGLATVMMGWIGTATLGAHEIALNIASLTFMVPLGVSAAGSVMVGRAIGRGDVAAARRDAVAALGVGVGFMACAAIPLLFAPGVIARLYTLDAPTLAVAVAIIPLAGVFQVFDGTQVVATGALRGTGDTRVPMLIHLAGFWGVGIPLSALLDLRFGLGATGIWWGLVAGLATVATLHLLRTRHRFARDIERIALDTPRAG
jgi:MATE family multidrug resistance protein